MKRLLTTLVFSGIILSGVQAQQTEADFIWSAACFGEPTILTSTSTVMLIDSIVLYAWDLDGDLSFDDAVGQSINHTFSGTNLIHNVGLRITTKYGTSKAKYDTVKVSDVMADFTFANTCFGDPTAFTSQAVVYNDNIVDWTWDFGDGLASKVPNPVYTYNIATNYMVTFTVLTQNGCLSSISKSVNITRTPDLEIIPSFPPISTVNGVQNFEFFEGRVLVVRAEFDSSVDSIIWSNGHIGNEVSLTQKGNYSVTAIDKNGCTSTVYFNITTIKKNDIYPMDVITPNKDGYNDRWFIKPELIAGDNYEVVIYNRWGDQVYTSSPYQNDWEGTYEGNELPEGAYYYIIKNNNNLKEVFKGVVNILR